MLRKDRKKTWEEKGIIAKNCYLRAKESKLFSNNFYQNLFFLKPDIKEYFSKTDFKHQHKLLIHGIDFLFGYIEGDEFAKTQIKRLGTVHNHDGLNIHPHEYYYWTEALILTIKELDSSWEDDFQYYLREIISFPVSYFISQFFILKKN